MQSEMKMVARREPKSSKWCYNKKKMFISWADKKSKQKDPKLVLLVSTMHDQMKVSKDQRTKPQAIVCYDHMKREVDLVDFISAVASMCIKSEQWTINALSYMLDTVHTNSKTLYNEVNKAKDASFKQLSTFKFTWELGQALALPWIRERCKTSEGLQMNIRAIMREVLKLPEVLPVPLQFVLPTACPPPPSVDKQTGCCETGREEIYGPRYAQAKQSLKRNNKDRCAVCRHFICALHKAIICGVCIENK